MTLCTAVGALLLVAGRAGHEPPNYSEIEPGLYLGGLVRDPPPGTRAVLNLCETTDPFTAGTHLWEPIRDAEPAPDLDWLARMVGFVAGHRRAGDVTFVHCRNGVSRSGMVVVAYEMAAHGRSRDEALAFVRERRPGVRPNPAFMSLLRTWEDRLRRPAPTGK
jgi:hypothetical protein